jgi:membrane protein implicated in regulation of membrane protease activity
MSLLLDVKFAAQILSLVILIIALILALRKFTTNNNGTQMLAGGDGVTSSNQDNIQITALNVNTV